MESGQRVMRRPPAWAVLGTVIGAPLFIGGVIVYIPWRFTHWRLAPAWFGFEPLRWLGAALILLSVPILIDFLVRFVIEGFGTPIPLAPPQRLVVRGSFRFVRNPAYLAALLAILGQALLFSSGGVLVYALILALGFHLFVVGYEEPSLQDKFGAEYELYRRSVPRWIPRVPRR